MPLFEVSYQLGKREPSGTFIGETAMWYKITVDAFSMGTAQDQVRSMMGGHDRCVIGSTFQKSS